MGADGVFYSELNEFLQRTLAEDGFSGAEVRVTPIRTEIIIRATRTREVLGEKGRRIRELTARVENRGMCASAQAESLRYKLLGGLVVRRACYGVMRFIMDSAAKGCEIIVSGKIRAQRAKAMKFRDGYMIKTGQPVKEYVDVAIRHVLMRQGVLGIKVSIMLPHDPTGKVPGLPNKPQADVVTIIEPKEEIDRPVTVAKKEAPVEEAAE